jgi:hypothetical protein
MEDEMGEEYSTHVKGEKCIKNSVQKPEWKRQL